MNRYGVFCGRVAPDWPGKKERSQGMLEKRAATEKTMRRSFKERNLLRESSIVASGDRHKRPHKMLGKRQETKVRSGTTFIDFSISNLVMLLKLSHKAGKR